MLSVAVTVPGGRCHIASNPSMVGSPSGCRTLRAAGTFVLIAPPSSENEGASHNISAPAWATKARDAAPRNPVRAAGRATIRATSGIVALGPPSGVIR